MNAEGMQGLRHLALNVTEIQRSQKFYENLFGMRVVWQPDSHSVYLSSGSDNLALHQIPQENLDSYATQRGQFLDHFGFLMASREYVDELFQRVQQEGIKIVKFPKLHRDGSYSFYLADPDDNTIQVLFEPNVSGIQK